MQYNRQKELSMLTKKSKELKYKPTGICDANRMQNLEKLNYDNFRTGEESDHNTGTDQDAKTTQHIS